MTVLLGLLIASTLILAGFAAWSDWRSLKIPNIAPLLIGLLFISALVVQEAFLDQPLFYTSIGEQLLAALTVFTVTAILFSLNMLGAGDSKLLTMLALFTGFNGLPSLLFWMAFFGGLLAFSAIVIKRNNLFKHIPECLKAKGSWLYQIENGRNAVPYGVAIFFGLIVAYGQMGYFVATFWQQ